MSSREASRWLLRNCPCKLRVAMSAKRRNAQQPVTGVSRVFGRLKLRLAGETFRLKVAHGPSRPNRTAGSLTLLALSLLFSLAAKASDWPQFRGPNRDGVWDETGILKTFPPEGLK